MRKWFVETGDIRENPEISAQVSKNNFENSFVPGASHSQVAFFLDRL